MTRQKTWKERRPVAVCELGVLHAFGPGFLHAPNRLLEFKGSGDRRLRVPLRGLKLVCVYGPVRVTAGAVRLITEAGAALTYLSISGSRVNGILQPATDEWKGRRYRHYQAAQQRSWMLTQARAIVAEKIESMIVGCRYFQRHGQTAFDCSRLLKRLRRYHQNALTAASHESLRGIEGTASRQWFDGLAAMLPAPWTFPGRRKRPPTDPVNALLSLGYTVLFNRVEAACQAWGLDASLGVFHEYRPGRSSLACDLVEPFRVPVVDRSLVSALSTDAFSPADFSQSPADNSVRMNEESWKRWLTLLESRLHEAKADEVSLHRQITARVGKIAEALPAWNGDWPGEAMNDGTDDVYSSHQEEGSRDVDELG